MIWTDRVSLCATSIAVIWLPVSFYVCSGNRTPCDWSGASPSPSGRGNENSAQQPGQVPRRLVDPGEVGQGVGAKHLECPGLDIIEDRAMET